MNVLVVDDNETNLLLVEYLVTGLGHRAVVFADPLAALAWTTQHEPDLVIVDYMMPVVDGLEFIRQFQGSGDRSEVPIVMVTAANDRDVRYRALELGARDFLTKPIDALEFKARITNLLALRKSRRQLADRAAWLSDEVTRATREVAAREQEIIFLLVRAVEYRDPETGSHIVRIAHYARLIAAGVGLSGAEQDEIFRAAPMHDIGKVGISDEILLKPGRLSQEEFERMKSHTVIGYEILKNSRIPLIRMAAQIALTHHERYDGLGYPVGLAADAIPLTGRIVALADAFDALTSARPYKGPWPVDRARALVEEQRGKHFDPHCVDAFLHQWPEVLAIRERFSETAGAETLPVPAPQTH